VALRPNNAKRLYMDDMTLGVNMIIVLVSRRLHALTVYYQIFSKQTETDYKICLI